MMSELLPKTEAYKIARIVCLTKFGVLLRLRRIGFVEGGSYER